MKILIQRVTSASVEVERNVISSIEEGVLVFIGVTHGDSKTQAVYLANKLIHLRLFEDING